MQSPNKLPVAQDFSYQYNLPQFSVNQQLHSPIDIKPQFNEVCDSAENLNSPAKKFKSENYFTDTKPLIYKRTSSPTNVLTSAYARSDSNWPNNANNQLMLGSNNYGNSLQNQQHSMINQEYFQTTDQQPTSGNHLIGGTDQKLKSYLSIDPTHNLQQQQQSYTNTNYNNFDQQSQMTLNMTNFVDNLTGFNQQSSHSNYNGVQQQSQQNHQQQRCNSTNNNSPSHQDTSNVGLPKQCANSQANKFNQSGFSNNSMGIQDSGVVAGSGPLPPASAMINTVEDMTGTFSSQFAHEIIKSMDDGTLFNFEENLVCNFDIDQLDETTNDVRKFCKIKAIYYSCPII